MSKETKGSIIVCSVTTSGKLEIKDPLPMRRFSVVEMKKDSWTRGQNNGVAS